MSAAHCTLCHETFTTVGNFDRHKRGPRRVKGTTGRAANRGSGVECHPPESVGLVRDHRGFWQTPGAENPWAA